MPLSARALCPCTLRSVDGLPACLSNQLISALSSRVPPSLTARSAATPTGGDGTVHRKRDWLAPRPFAVRLPAAYLLLFALVLRHKVECVARPKEFVCPPLNVLFRRLLADPVIQVSWDAAALTDLPSELRMV